MLRRTPSKVTQAGRDLHPRAWLPPLNTASNPVLPTSQLLATGSYLNSLKGTNYLKLNHL